MDTGLRALADQRERARRQLQAILEAHAGKDPRTTEELCRRFLSRGHDHWAVHAILGSTLLLRGRPEAALASLRRSATMNPGSAKTWFLVGNAFQELRELDQALNSYRKALELDPDLAEVHLHLGAALEGVGRTDEAIAAFRRAETLRPDLVEVHINLGNTLQQREAFHEALAAYDRALELRPDDPRALRNRGALQLLMGRYPEGWQGREARFVQKPGLLHQPDLGSQLPLWDGSSQVDGELVIVTEQGYGDIFLFCRYGSWLRRRLKRVSLVVEAKLHGLLARAELFDHLHALPLDPATLPADSRWIPLLSVPHRLQATPGSPPLGAPYLRANPDRVAHWQRLLRDKGTTGTDRECLVGLHWQGNVQHELTSNRQRSFPLEQFAPLAAVAGVRLVSLQKGPGSEQLAHCSFRDRFTAAQEEVDATWDFLETAAIVQACDLVVSSDSAVPHLAGALGQETWTLLKKVPEWRWGLEGEDTPWYPSMRLFRQTRSGDWQEVMARVAEALRARVLEGTPRNRHAGDSHPIVESSAGERSAPQA